MRLFNGNEIEKRSFEIIDKRIPVGVYSKEEHLIIRKIIHTTADFSLRKNIYFSQGAIKVGIEKLTNNCNIFTDVLMVSAGISPTYLENFKGKIICTIRDSKTKELSEKLNITRASASVRIAVENYENIGIFAIGNAPTALFEIIDLAKKGKISKDVLVIGACVGMVGAKESKEELINSGLPCIVIRGKRGGSPIAATIVNGLFKLLKGGKI